MTQLNEKVVKSLPTPETGNKVHYFPDAKLRGTKAPAGFGVRVTSNGARSFVLNYRSKHVERRITIGQYPAWSVIKAVKEAKELRQRIDKGEDPLEARRKEEAAKEAAKTDTLQAICAEYFKREGGKLRSRESRERTLNRLVHPQLGTRDIATIRRSEIVKLLDKIEDENGATMATRTLAYVGRVFNWHASRTDDFVSPIVRGMARVKAKERVRQRILSDAELQAVWKAAEASTTPYGALARFILLTGCRPGEAAGMTREELDAHRWVLPAARNKVKLDLLRPLSKQAMAVLPPGNGKFVFSTKAGTSPRGGYYNGLTELHQASGTSGWHWHDLRRSARSLMSRAGVPVDHAEQCLGHVIGGIRANYDVYKYEKEKAEAYVALASLIERILNPVDNVTQLHGRAS
jgi:integrase